MPSTLLGFYVFSDFCCFLCLTRTSVKVYYIKRYKNFLLKHVLYTELPFFQDKINIMIYTYTSNILHLFLFSIHCKMPIVCALYVHVVNILESSSFILSLTYYSKKSRWILKYFDVKNSFVFQIYIHVHVLDHSHGTRYEYVQARLCFFLSSLIDNTGIHSSWLLLISGHEELDLSWIL